MMVRIVGLAVFLVGFSISAVQAQGFVSGRDLMQDTYEDAIRLVQSTVEGGVQNVAQLNQQQNQQTVIATQYIQNLPIRFAAYYTPATSVADIIPSTYDPIN